ncbi:MAG: putative Ig domain-containing protein [Actinomycetota bacterium]|nr:putative Ig domain-containing protein [Actinomycetota bacterium]
MAELINRSRRTLIATCAAMALIGAGLFIPVSSASAAGALSPRLGAAVAGITTKVTVLGSGFTPTSQLGFVSCSLAGAPTPMTSFVSSSRLIAMVPSFADGASCTAQVATGGARTTVGSYGWTAKNVAFVTTTGIAPSILPKEGGGFFLFTASVANPTAGVGDTTLTGLTSVSLNCPASGPGGGTVTISATAQVKPNGLQMSVTPGSFSTAASGACPVSVTLASGNVITTATPNAPGVWEQPNVPAITLSTYHGAENQTVGSLQKITVSATSSLAGATGVSFNYCPASNPQGTYPAALVQPAADPTQLSVTVPAGVPTGACAVVIGMPPTGSRPAGYTVASVPAAVPSVPPTSGFTFDPPYQGPITVTIANPYTSGLANTGVADSSLYVSVLGDPTGGGDVTTVKTGTSANLFAGFTAAKLVSAPFTSMSGYDSVKHTATLTLTPPVKSGNLYLSNQSLTGSAPDPTASTARYGFVEFTYNASGLDVDLTLIDQIGFTLSSTLLDKNSAVIPGTYRDTGCLVDIVNAFSNTGVKLDATTASTPGVMRYSTSTPQATPAPGAWTWSQLAGNGTWAGIVGASKLPGRYPKVDVYVNSVKGPLTVRDQLGDPLYGGQFNYSAELSGGVWTLTGTVADGTKLGPKLQIEQAGVSAQGSHGGTGFGVYGQNGPFLAYEPAKGSTPGSPSYGPALSWAADGGVTADWSNAVKTIYRDFIAAFAYGYWNTTEFPSSTDTGASGQNFTRNPLDSAYANAQGNYGPPAQPAQYAWNVYDEVIRSHSNIDGGGSPKPSGAYGMAYSDTFVPSDLSPNQSQEFAYSWNLTLGDPATCKDPRSSLLPQRQQLHLPVDAEVVPVKAGSLASSGRQFVEYTASGFSGPVTFTLARPDGSPVKLPAGLTFHRSTGMISGSAKVNAAAQNYEVTASDGRSSASALLNLGVGTATLTPTAQTIVSHLGVSLTASAKLTASGFPSEPSYAIAPALPAGLRLDERTGVVSGTPTQTRPVRGYAITATSGQVQAQASLSLEILPAWSISPIQQTVVGQVGVPITPSAVFAVVGFATSPVYSIAPALPSGLTLNSSTGVISGTASQAAATLNYRITSRGTTGSAAATVTLTVNPVVHGITPPTQTLTGTRGIYQSSVPLRATGFSGALIYALSPPAVPAGMWFNSATGVMSGTPTQNWNTRYTVTGSDGINSNAVTISVVIAPSVGPAPSPQPTPKPSVNPTPVCPPGSFWIASIGKCVTIN